MSHEKKEQEKEATDVPTWATIKSYFTVDEQQCMLGVTNGSLDLLDCASVMQWAAKIYPEVQSGAMPKGDTRWTDEMVANFYTWWKNGNCN